MKNKKAQPLNFTNVCNIRAYLSIAISNQIKNRRQVVQTWGANGTMTKIHNSQLRELVNAYRAAQNIEIVS